MQEDKSLILLKNATRMLAECKTIPEVKKIVDMAEVMRVYVEKMHLGEGIPF